MKNQNTTQNIGQAILEALAFFDLFKKPLTAFEIWQFIKAPVSMSDVSTVLDNGIVGVEKSGAFYYLRGRENLVLDVPAQQDLIYKKFKIAKRACQILRFVNGVKMVSVCNNFYYTKQSDVDVLIVLESGRMWLSRFLVTILLHIFKLRRHSDRSQDRICLSFYVTEDHLNLRSLTIKPLDPYFYFWLAYLFPIYDDGIYKQFVQSNIWIKDKLPNMIAQAPSSQKQVRDNFSSHLIKTINKVWFNSFLGDAMEKKIRKMQLARMAKNKNSLSAKNDSRVIISDLILKFHENDRRKDIINKLKNIKYA